MDGLFLVDPLQPAMMASAKCFLHNQTAKELEECGAIIPGVDMVFILCSVSNVVCHTHKYVFQPPPDSWSIIVSCLALF